MPLKDNARGDWYDAANYYYGCCSFFEGKYDDAAKSFARCESSDKYKANVPYYLTQIYAAQKNYDKVISYGTPRAKDTNVKNRAEINQLVGQAYYEKGDYKSALPYLEFAAKNGVALRPADYYQLGYTQYQNGLYKPAIRNFEELSKARQSARPKRPLPPRRLLPARKRQEQQVQRPQCFWPGGQHELRQIG